jgi:hypothetical protein
MKGGYTPEERAAWDLYFASISSKDVSTQVAAAFADDMLAERRQRFAICGCKEFHGIDARGEVVVAAYSGREECAVHGDKT